jgi:hypothetical protein
MESAIENQVFQVGDIVEGLDIRTPSYGITGPGSISQVVKLTSLRVMEVRVIKGLPNSGFEGHVYEVEIRYFKLKERKKEIVKMETDVNGALDVLQRALESKQSEIERLVSEGLSARTSEIELLVKNKIDTLVSSGILVKPEEVESQVKRAVNSRMVQTLVIKDGHGEQKKLDLAHEDLPVLLKMVNTRNTNGHRLNIYMHGPAGSGKSTAAHQVADALGLPFGYSSLNPMTPDSRALGFMHAGGDYVGTEFFKRYTEGGVFCFDEIDNASASFVTTLNSALENGHGAFPHGVYARHPDFVCICTANTIGRGGDIYYPERRALDSAFLERFVFLEWEYDNKLTLAIVGGILGDKCSEHMDWVDGKAKEYRAKYPELVISPRAYIQSALLVANGFNKTEIEAATIARGVKSA